MLCRAKVNLTLHVGAPIRSGLWTGYHPVESLVVFADIGDEILAMPAEKTVLSIDGPFGDGLTAGTDNLIIKALSACDASPHAIDLTKRIPVSAGLGGGSANAAAILRLFDKKNRVDATQLGADVPVCRLSRTAMMEGIGERITAMPGLGTHASVLVNPGIPVSTGRIFKRYDQRTPPANPAKTSKDGRLLDRARSGTNDLQRDAISEVPEIQTVLDNLQAQEGCDLARMSGSGASCFGLYESDDAARQAARALSQNGWWAVATRLGDAP